MRIVAIADTHTFEADLGVLPAGDVLIHAGDLLRAGTLDELAPVAAWIQTLDFAHKIVVAGNHDGCFADSRSKALALLGEDVVYLEDEGVSIDGVTFWGSPWQPAYNDWAFNLPRGAALAEKWALIPETTDVLITHGPPEGIGDTNTTRGRQGCKALRARVEAVAPALHMFGHIHQDGGVWQHGPTCFANVTTWESERAATVFDIDPLTRAVTAVTVPPRETPQ